MKKVLITGVTGFAGQYLAEKLLDKDDYDIHGTYRSDEGLERIGDLRGKISLHKADLTEQKLVAKIITDVQPDQVYHLAAQTSPSQSLKDPAGTLNTNVMSELSLFQGILLSEKKDTRVVAISTSEIYGAVDPSDLPIDENTPFRPITPYAVSKITQDYLSLYYFLAHKLQIVRARPFNHSGPRQQARLVIPMFAKQIAEIEKGKKEPILKVGNLDARKDFCDVRDVVEAYRMLMEKGEPGEAYNIGSGKSAEVREMLTILLSFSQKTIAVEVDQELYRPIDTPEVVCDHSKLTELTGWQPTIPLQQTLQDTLDYFRKVV